MKFSNHFKILLVLIIIFTYSILKYGCKIPSKRWYELNPIESQKQAELAARLLLNGYGDLKDYTFVFSKLKDKSIINSPDHYDGNRPLHHKIFDPNPEVLEFLILNGGDLTKTNKYEESPLHWTTKFRKDDVSKLYLKYSSNLDSKDKYGITPFFWIIFYNNTNLLKYILKNQIAFDQFICGHHFTIAKAKEDKVDIFLKKCQEYSNKIDFIDLAIKGDIVSLRTIIKYNPLIGKVDFRLKYLGTGLDISQIDLNILKELAKIYGLSLNLLNYVKGDNPLSKVINLNSLKVLSIILEKKVDLFPETMHPPLYSAIDTKNFKIVKLLIDRNAHKNSEYYEFFSLTPTPILYARRALKEEGLNEIEKANIYQMLNAFEN